MTTETYLHYDIEEKWVQSDSDLDSIRNSYDFFYIKTDTPEIIVKVFWPRLKLCSFSWIVVAVYWNKG